VTELPAHCEAADRDRDNRTFVPCRSLATKVIQPEEGGPCLHFCDRHARDLAMEGDQVANLRPVPMTPPQPNRASAEPMDRNETIKTIRAALRRRSGKLWSVTGGRGTAWGWLSIDARALDMLDEPIASRLKGLLEKRPLHFDPAVRHGEFPYRPFRSLLEIEEARASVELTETLGRVLVDPLGWDLRSIVRGADPTSDPPRVRTLFLTSMAWHDAGAELRGEPIPREEAASFLRTALDPEAARRALQRFVDRIVRETELGAWAASQLVVYGRASLAGAAEEPQSLWVRG